MLDCSCSDGGNTYTAINNLASQWFGKSSVTLMLSTANEFQVSGSFGLHTLTHLATNTRRYLEIVLTERPRPQR
jgi:hypothetical protein